MKTKFNKRNFPMRIIVLPFIFGLLFVSHTFFMFKRTYHFLLYGGEYINFEEPERENINEIFKMLKEMKRNNEL